MLEIIGQGLGILATVMTILMFQLKNKTQMLLVNIVSNAAVAANVLFIKGEFNSGVIICLIAIVQIIVSHIHDKKGTAVPLLEKIQVLKKFFLLLLQYFICLQCSRRIRKKSVIFYSEICPLG